MITAYKQGTNIGFRCAQLELNETNLGLLYPSGTTNGSNNILVKDYAFNEFSVLNCSANFLDDTNIAEIHVGRCRCHKASDCRNCDGASVEEYCETIC